METGRVKRESVFFFVDANLCYYFFSFFSSSLSLERERERSLQKARSSR
jgi:hypothetical protein